MKKKSTVEVAFGRKPVSRRRAKVNEVAERLCRTLKIHDLDVQSIHLRKHTLLSGKDSWELQIVMAVED